LAGIGRRARKSGKHFRDLGRDHITGALRGGRNSRFLLDADVFVSSRTVTT